MPPRRTRKTKDTLPCQHEFDAEQLDRAKELILNLHQTHPAVLEEANLPADDEGWGELAREAIESLRGTFASDTSEKDRFVRAILHFCQERGTIQFFEAIGGERRQDWKVVLTDGTRVAIESKGGGDGNNTTIWHRPSWAQEFVVWSQSPQSLHHPPGKGVWSALANRLLPSLVEHTLPPVDAFIFWDGRCGSAKRNCPKNYGFAGELRGAATRFGAAGSSADWLPPPCVFMLPRERPEIPNNRQPELNSLGTSAFVRALFDALEVPEGDRPLSIGQGHVRVEGTAEGTNMFIHVISPPHEDGELCHVETQREGKLASRAV